MRPPDDDPLLEAIGHRLRQRRLERGLTQAALAEAASVSPRFLVELEGGRGNISVQRLAAVCSCLKLPLQQLFRGLGPETREKLSLVGLRGAGKSTLGRALAARLGAPFVELDERVEALAGLPLAEIFEMGGAARYRELEAAAIERVLAEPGGAVLAVGGSVVTEPLSWRRLREETLTVWLKAPPSAHFERVTAQGDLRPMRDRPDALRELSAILAAREPLYAQAEVHLDTETLGLEGALERLAALAPPGVR